MLRAKTIFQQEVLPLLQAAGLHIDVQYTRQPGDAARLVKTADLAAVDVFAVVGGDGTIHELLQVGSYAEMRDLLASMIGRCHAWQ